MKKIITKYSVYVIIVVMLSLLVPGISKRIENEGKNKNVTMSVLYNDIANKVTAEKFYENLEEYKKIGVNTVSIMEEDLNYMVARGDLTCIKYNVLRHKYDDESLEIADYIAQNCPDVTYDSYILLVDREDMKEKLKYNLPRQYSSDEFAAIGAYDDLDLYVMYNGRKELWDYTIGYNEKEIQKISDMGFDIALIHKVKNRSNVEYLEDLERIVKNYDVKYLNIKTDSSIPDADKVIEENYKGISRIINENDMTLVVTENMDQLSNQKCLGYGYIFDETMKEGGSRKIIRSYETYDDVQADESNFKYRAEQYFNSTIDRNIRFITITQIAVDKKSYSECADYTLEAVKLYKDKITKEGFTIDKQPAEMDYKADKERNYAACAVIMILCILLMIEMVIGKKCFVLTLSAILLSVLAFAATFVIPSTLMALYPTAFCVIQSCFAVTTLLYLLKKKKDDWSTVKLLLSSLFVMLFVLFVGAVCMGTLLSGMEYYINNEIFRGIKISLIAPVFYTCILFYFMFIKVEKSKIWTDIKKVLYSDIKVYWVLIGGAILVVGAYYIIRSGNVNQISGIEHFMRSKLTEIFPARPRTKEFLIGYPSLVLFVYYMKNTKLQLVKWLLAIGTSILAASITNSFCHVFTDFSVITMRTVNAFILGVIVSVFAYVANLILIKILTKIKERFCQNTEMR